MMEIWKTGVYILSTNLKKSAYLPGSVLRLVCIVLNSPEPWRTNKQGWMRFTRFWLSVFGRKNDGCDVLEMQLKFDEKELRDFMEGNDP